MSPVVHCGYVAIVGRPNVGKSTLLNALVGEKVSIVTDKPHTTRQRVLGVMNHAEGQALFLDTPGVGVAGKGALQKVMQRALLQAIDEADLLVLVIDARGLTPKDEAVFALVAGREERTLLVLNKVDTLASKSALLPLLEQLAERHRFLAIIPVSARTGHNMPVLKREVITRLPVGPRLFPDDAVTDRDTRFRIAEIIREKLMLQLRDELPYKLTVEIENLTRDGEGQWQVHALIWIERESHKAIIVGKGGEGLKRVGKAARVDIAKLLGARVHLETWVKLRQRWSDNEQELKRLGFDVQ